MEDPRAFASHLMDLELAAEVRCELNAAAAHAEPLRAHLLLQAARHRSNVETLNDAVNELEGVTHTGTSDAVFVDPLGPGVLGSAADDRALLDDCIAEQAKALPAYEDALRRAEDRHWPPSVRPLIARCADAARQSHAQLVALRERIATEGAPG